MGVDGVVILVSEVGMLSSGGDMGIVVVLLVFFFSGTATTEIYTEYIVGSVRCV